jgi:hypothetical protein
MSERIKTPTGHELDHRAMVSRMQAATTQLVGIVNNDSPDPDAPTVGSARDAALLVGLAVDLVTGLNGCFPRDCYVALGGYKAEVTTFPRPIGAMPTAARFLASHIARHEADTMEVDYLATVRTVPLLLKNGTGKDMDELLRSVADDEAGITPALGLAVVVAVYGRHGDVSVLAIPLETEGPGDPKAKLVGRFAQGADGEPAIIEDTETARMVLNGGPTDLSMWSEHTLVPDLRREVNALQGKPRADMERYYHTAARSLGAGDSIEDLRSFSKALLVALQCVTEANDGEWHEPEVRGMQA